MRKNILLTLSMLTVLCCLFALTAFAQEGDPDVTDTFYVVSSQDSQVALDLKSQGKEVIVLSEVYASTSGNTTSGSDWIDGFEEGSHIELIFAENIVESVAGNTGILLAKEITLTVRYNGFVHLISNLVGVPNVFVLKHSCSKINLIGTSEIFDENGLVIKDFTYNSTDLSKNKVQIRHSKVYCWVYDGDAYVENIRSTTGQELVYVDTDNSSDDPSVVNTYEFVNCALYSSTDPVGLLGQNSAPKIIKISGGYYSSICLNTICTDSYIKNCGIGGRFYMDCWGISNQMLVFENTTLGGSITTATGRTNLSFYDCDFDIAKLSLGNDGGGVGYALVYTSVTCDQDGSLNVYKKGSNSIPVNSKDVNNDSRYADTLAAFYANEDNYAKGHTNEVEYSFSGEKYLSAFVAKTACTKCGNVESTKTVDALFACLGVSVPEFGDHYSITLGFKVDNEAVNKYEELTGTALSYGFVAAAEKNLGAKVSPLDEQGNVISLASGKVIKADMTDDKNSYLVLNVTLTSEHADTALLMCSYIIEAKDSSLEVSYAQGNSIVRDNNFTYVSYNNH